MLRLKLKQDAIVNTLVKPSASSGFNAILYWLKQHANIHMPVAPNRDEHLQDDQYVIVDQMNDNEMV